MSSTDWVKGKLASVAKDARTVDQPMQWLFIFVMGAIVGCIVSVTVNCTLIEITINPVFGIYFGTVFIMIGGLILWRIVTTGHPHAHWLTPFSCLVLISGLFCFSLEDEWFVGLSYISKIPVYALLGVSVCFAFMFSLVDLLNQFILTREDQSPWIETEKQMIVLLVTSVSLGFIFGLVFGVLDVEDVEMHHLQLKMMREQTICYPFGLIIGGVSACVNQYLRLDKDYIFQRVGASDPFEEDFENLL